MADRPLQVTSTYVYIQQEFLLGRSEGKGHSRQREQRLGQEGVNESPGCIPGVAQCAWSSICVGRICSLICSLTHSLIRGMNVGDDTDSHRIATPH